MDGVRVSRSNGNGFGDIWWTDNPIYFSSTDGMVIDTVYNCKYHGHCINDNFINDHDMIK